MAHLNCCSPVHVHIPRPNFSPCPCTVCVAQFLDHGLLVTHTKDNRVGHVFSNVGGTKKSGAPPTPFTLSQVELSKRVEKMTLHDLKVMDHIHAPLLHFHCTHPFTITCSCIIIIVHILHNVLLVMVVMVADHTYLTGALYFCQRHGRW